MDQLKFDFTTNMGGVCRVFAIPVSSFVNVSTDSSSDLTSLVVINRENIIDIYITEDSGEWNEEYVDGLYSIFIAGIIPKSQKLNAKQLLRLETEYWFVLSEDNNGQIRLAGSEENQLSFKRRSSTGIIGQRNQVEFEFVGNQTHGCYYIELQNMDDL